MAKVPPGTKRIEVYLPKALADRLEALIWSPALNRVPYGALNSFMVQRVNEFFNTRRVPMGDYAGFNPADWLSGPQSAINETLSALADRRQAPDGLDEAFPELGPFSGDTK